MNFPKVEIWSNESVQSNHKVVVGINEIPFPTAMYFLESKRLILNRRAYECFGLKVGEAFDFDSWKDNNSNLIDTVINGGVDIFTNQKLHVILPNGNHEIMNISMTHINNLHLGNIYIINFTKAVEKYSITSISSLYNIKDDILKLKPYLNRAGRNVVESFTKKFFKDENQQLTLDDIVYYKKELYEIQKAFPSLSYREVVLCGLLVNGMESKDIASITNRTIDSVFVTIHRINKKLNFESKKDLTETLKGIVLNKRSLPTFKEFDA